MAPVRSAPVSIVPVRSLLDKSTPLKVILPDSNCDFNHWTSMLVRLALVRSAPVSIVPVRSAPVSIVPVRSLPDRLTSVRFVLYKLAPVSIVPVRSLPDKSV